MWPLRPPSLRCKQFKDFNVNGVLEPSASGSSVSTDVTDRTIETRTASYIWRPARHFLRSNLITRTSHTPATAILAARDSGVESALADSGRLPGPDSGPPFRSRTPPLLSRLGPESGPGIRSRNPVLESGPGIRSRNPVPEFGPATHSCGRP